MLHFSIHELNSSYAGIMLDAFDSLLCSWHKSPGPSTAIHNLVGFYTNVVLIILYAESWEANWPEKQIETSSCYNGHSWHHNSLVLENRIIATRYWQWYHISDHSINNSDNLSFGSTNS